MSTRQVIPSVVGIRDATIPVVFTVDGQGGVNPTAHIELIRGDSFTIRGATPEISGAVCASRAGCKCSDLVAGATSTSHIAIRNEAYQVGPTAAGDYTIYVAKLSTSTISISSSGPITNGTNGDIHVGTGTKGDPSY